jgi:hypothetical protein
MADPGKSSEECSKTADLVIAPDIQRGGNSRTVSLKIINDYRWNDG